MSQFSQKMRNIASKVSSSLPHDKVDTYLMRDYIAKKLYNENEGYYGINTPMPIGRLDVPLNLKDMRGVHEYSKSINQRYPRSSWLTCPELLRPYFGYSLGNYILTKNLVDNQAKENIKIVEIGCGMGGAIDSILEYLHKFSISSYKSIEYVGIELNETMAKSTETLLKTKHPELYNSGQISILNKSLYDLDITSEFVNNSCFVLALNLFNSLPHDRFHFTKMFQNTFKDRLEDFYIKKNIHLDNRKDIESYKIGFKELLMSLLKTKPELIKMSKVQEKYTNNKESFEQIITNIDTNDDLTISMLFYHLIPEEDRNLILGEQFSKIELDRSYKYKDWFLKLLEYLNHYKAASDFVWLPTGAVELFSKLNQSFPKHHLVLFDYDLLPPKLTQTDYSGKNSPTIYSIQDGSVDYITHKSVFDSFNTVHKPVNVYFPQDFKLLQIMYKLICNQSASINKFQYFNEHYAMSEWSDTITGFNPLRDTHHNTSFLLTVD